MPIFSTQEIDLAGNPHWLLIKNNVIKKAISLMGEVEQELKEEVSIRPYTYPTNVKTTNGKISKGENYKGLPFVILDYPAKFTKADMFAYRTMFYWGHFVSFTFHIQGDSLNFLMDRQLMEYVQQFPELWFSVYETPWEYVYKDSVYQQVQNLSIEEMHQHVKEHGFVKVSHKIPVDAIEQTPQEALGFFKRFMTGLSEI
jgi:hypothetical protein